MNWFDVTINSIEAKRINDKFLGRFSKWVDWLEISRHGDECLTAELIEKYADFLCWSELSVSRHWSDDEMRRFADRMDFGRMVDRRHAEDGLATAFSR